MHPNRQKSKAIEKSFQRLFINSTADTTDVAFRLTSVPCFGPLKTRFTKSRSQRLAIHTNALNESSIVTSPNPGWRTASRRRADLCRGFRPLGGAIASDGNRRDALTYGAATAPMGSMTDDPPPRRTEPHS